MAFSDASIHSPHLSENGSDASEDDRSLHTPLNVGPARLIVPPQHEILDLQLQYLEDRLTVFSAEPSLDLADPVEYQNPEFHHYGIRSDTAQATLDLRHIVDRLSFAMSDIDRSRIAIELLSSRYALDWASNSLPFDPTIVTEDDDHLQTEDRYHFAHYLDLIHVQSISHQSLTVDGGHFLNFKLTTHYWHRPFSATHDLSFHFNLKGKTFFLGSHDRLKWYIVMHPNIQTHNPIHPQPKQTKMDDAHATALFSFILHIFGTSQLAHLNINAFTASIHSPSTHDLGGPDFHYFQRFLMERWEEHMLTDTSDPFWFSHVPHIHVYDYGMNAFIIDSTENTQETMALAVEDSFVQYFNPQHISQLSFAIATEVEIQQRTSNGFVRRTLIANANKVQAQFNLGNVKPFTIYPIAFSPTACNFQSQHPPRVVRLAHRDSLCQINRENNSIDDVITVGTFQNYNTTKQHARQTMHNFLLSQGSYTATYCTGPHLSQENKRRFEAQRVKCDQHQPYKQFISAIEQTYTNEKINTRCEHIWTVHWSRLLPENRKFKYLVENVIVNLCNVYNKRGDGIVVDFMDVFPLEVVPNLMCSTNDRYSLECISHLPHCICMPWMGWSVKSCHISTVSKISFCPKRSQISKDFPPSHSPEILEPRNLQL